MRILTKYLDILLNFLSDPDTVNQIILLILKEIEDIEASQTNSAVAVEAKGNKDEY